MPSKKDWQRIYDEFAASERAWKEKHDKIWADMTEEQRLAAADVIFRAIDAHAREGGSMRYLIYDRLGLSSGSYRTMYCAGAMNVSNIYKLKSGGEEDA